MSDKRDCGAIAAQLNDILRGDAWADPLTRAMYSTDASIYQIQPLCVAFPRDGADVAAVVRFAHENNLSVVPRGAGSGLAGESIGPGIVIDMSRYMADIVEINSAEGYVKVGAGVVLEQLNRRLAPLGKQIGPDPASGNRATIGGMIGNNSTGAHSLKYGYIGNHLRSLEVVAADGEMLRLDALLSNGSNGKVGQWSQQVYQLLDSQRELLNRVKPKSDRNGSGYNVFAALQNGGVNLAELLAGSEGTLAVVTEATIGIVDLPRHKALLQVNYDSLGNMARAVAEIVKADPYACELMDESLLKLARDAYKQYHDVLPGDVAASLLIEVDGDSEGEIDKKLTRMTQLVRGLPSNSQSVSLKEIRDKNLQSRVWAARKAGVPLLFRNKSALQPIPVIEDVAVSPEQLAEYLEGLSEITHRMDIPIAYYAHAGHGELHPRPYLNLHEGRDVKKLRQLADEVFALVWKLGGTISGEHGEGLVRAGYIRQQYGDEMYEVFRQIKQIFDPEGTLNPGKIINDDPEVMTKDLRFSYAQPFDGRPLNLQWRDDEFTREVEQCNGNGLCRSSDPLLSMCPIFRATGNEAFSPRAKGNLMRHWAYGLLDSDILASPEFKAVADMCVNCKMCALQCPSLVNIPKLMLEARAAYVKEHGLTRTQFMLTRSEFMSRMGCTFGPLANMFLQASWFRRILEWVGGLDHHRAMPRFKLGSNVKKLRRYLRRATPIAHPVAKVAYFVDLYATFNDHELGRCAVDVLRHNNVEVIVPPQIGVSMPAISYGAIDYARKAVEFNLKHMAEAVRDGYTIVASEPTAALCLKEEYLDIVDSEDARLVSKNALEFTEFLSQLHRQGKLVLPERPVNIKVAYHEPCHYGYMQIEGGTRQLMSLVEGLEIEELPNSCCGIAGTFGFQKGKYELSMQVGEPMLGPLRESEAEFGLTECGTCKMQMELGSGKEVLHPIKVLAKAYGLL
ncbi:MAG: anaerobic glycerol-3-phosphate dehydrogenase subunit C [Sedimentisphaerales bacterium]|nr:anaerobic glycerol-3-phosphate dehydrogenase subunit C [Sedimentisphaerales bacterium]